MAEHSDVIDRVDALMRSEGLSPAGRRRRSFIAAPASSEEPFELLTHPEDDDLPVLTEIVSAEAGAAAARASVHTPASRPAPQASAKARRVRINRTGQPVGRARPSFISQPLRL